MADITVTVASVVKGSGASVADGIAAVTITAGVAIYKDTALGTMKLCIDDTAAEALCAGVSLHATLAGQPIQWVTKGQVTLGSVLAQGETYIVSRNAGKIAPVADAVASAFTTIIGIAISASVLDVNIQASGVVHD